MVEDLEVFFMKEVVTQGYMIQKQDEQEDYIFYVFKGQCRLLLSTSTFPQVDLMGPNRKYFVIGKLKRGDSFGE